MMSQLYLVAFAMPGGFELMIIAFVAVLLFGHRLPAVMSSLGKSVHTFRSALEGDETN